MPNATFLVELIAFADHPLDPGQVRHPADQQGDDRAPGGDPQAVRRARRGQGRRPQGRGGVQGAARPTPSTRRREIREEAREQGAQIVAGAAGEGAGARPTGSSSTRRPRSRPSASRSSPRCAPRSASLAIELAGRIVGESLERRRAPAPRGRALPRPTSSPAKPPRTSGPPRRASGGRLSARRKPRGARRGQRATRRGARIGRRRGDHRRRRRRAVLCRPAARARSPGCARALADAGTDAADQARAARRPVRVGRVGAPTLRRAARRSPARAGRARATWSTAWRSSASRRAFGRPDAPAASTRSRTSCSASPGSSSAAPTLRAALSDPVLPVDDKRDLVHSLLAGKASPVTVPLVEQRRLAPRGRTTDPRARRRWPTRPRGAASARSAGRARRSAARPTDAQGTPGRRRSAARYGRDVHLHDRGRPERGRRHRRPGRRRGHRRQHRRDGCTPGPAAASTGMTSTADARHRTARDTEGQEPDDGADDPPGGDPRARSRRTSRPTSRGNAREEVGRVAETGDGIARVEGLHSAMTNELLEFEGGMLGVALNLDIREIGCVLLGDVRRASRRARRSRRTGEILSVPVGDALPRPRRRPPRPAHRRQGRDRQSERAPRPRAAGAVGRPAPAGQASRCRPASRPSTP